MGTAEPLTQLGLLGEAVDTGPALVFVADDLMRYIAVNQAACEALGYTRDELLGLRVTDVARAVEAPSQFYEMIGDGSRDGVAELTRRDGSTFRFVYRARKTRVAHGEVYISVGFPV